MEDTPPKEVIDIIRAVFVCTDISLKAEMSEHPLVISIMPDNISLTGEKIPGIDEIN